MNGSGEEYKTFELGSTADDITAAINARARLGWEFITQSVVKGKVLGVFKRKKLAKV
jgi:hypothetical protein